jgi:MFS family permease
VATLIALRLDFDETAGSTARQGDVASDGGDGIRSLEEFVSHSRLLFTGGFVIVFVIGILYGIYFRGAFTFLPDILAGLPLFEPVGLAGRKFEPSQYVYSGLLLLGGVGQYAGGRLVDRVRVESALVTSYLALVAIGLAFVPSSNAGLVPLLVVAGLLGFTVFMVAPINQEAIAKYSEADVRGLSFGYTYTAIFGVGAVGATLAGFILTGSSPAVLFVVIAGIVGVAALLGAYLLQRSD